ncbi:MAG: hypothetical protein JST84_22190 [Acidobacteria bacterium]|nr:hypothetical protein [Acidobacteriota bacterium]
MKRFDFWTRRTLACLLMVLTLSVVLANKYYYVSAKILQTRTVELHKGTFPQEAIEIIGYRNLQAPEFPAGFQMEVKNISSKPIYFINFAINFADYSKNGAPFSLKISWGNPKLINNSAIADQADISIKPGEIIVLKVDPRTASNYARHFKENNVSPNKLILVPQIINFGDGTGFQLGTPYPRGASLSSGECIDYQLADCGLAD